MEFEDGFTLKDWKDVSNLDDGVLGDIIVNRLKDLYESENNVNLKFDVELEKIHRRLESITDMKRSTSFYNKYFYFLAQDLELTSMINSEHWYMDYEEVKNSINRDEYVFLFKRHKDDEDFSYSTVDEYMSVMTDYTYSHSLEGMIEAFKREFDMYYKKYHN